MKPQTNTDTHDTPHPSFDRLKFLNRREQQITTSKKIKGDNSFFSGAQSYVNEIRLFNIISEREQILSHCN